jgi:hypothetical protein
MSDRRFARPQAGRFRAKRRSGGKALRGPASGETQALRDQRGRPRGGRWRVRSNREQRGRADRRIRGPRGNRMANSLLIVPGQSPGDLTSHFRCRWVVGKLRRCVDWEEWTRIWSGDLESPDATLLLARTPGGAVRFPRNAPCLNCVDRCRTERDRLGERLLEEPVSASRSANEDPEAQTDSRRRR